MALYTTSPTQKALSPMEQLLQIKKKKTPLEAPSEALTLLTPQEQQVNMGTTPSYAGLSTIENLSPMEQLLQSNAGAATVNVESAPAANAPAANALAANAPAANASSVPLGTVNDEYAPAANAPSVPKGTGDVTAPRSVKNPNGRTAAQIASDAAWTFVSSNKDWFGEDARKLFETDQQWHDRLLAKKKAAFVPSMETVYDENGRPVEVGYFDWGGNWVRTRDLSSLNAAMAGLAEAANATPTLIDIRGTPEYQSLTELQKQLNDPNNTQADMDAAEQRAAEEMGLTVPELRQRLADMREQANLGKNAQQGMTQQEISEFDRKTALERQELLRQGQEILQQVMGKSGGSAIAASNARNNIINTLAGFQAQKDAQQTELDWEKKIAEYDALVARYDQLFQQKDITAGRYLDAIKEDRTAAIQATFYQLNALAQQNQAEIDKYTAIGSMRYQEVMAQLGVLQGVSEQELNDFEKYIAPIRLQMEQEALEAQKNAQSANNILGIISSVIGTIALFA